MLAMFIWVIGFAVSISAIALAAGANEQTAHLYVSAFIALAIAVAATLELGKAAREGQSRSRLAAVTARYMGLLWAWSSVAVAVTYALVLTWVNWVPVFTVLMLGAGTCLFVARILDRESTLSTPDARIVNLVKLMAWGKFGGTCLIVGALVAAGKLGPAGFGGQSRWAAMNILLCTAAGLTLISGYALMLRKDRAPDEAADGVNTVDAAAAGA